MSINLDAIKARLAEVHAAGVSGVTVRLSDYSLRVTVQMRSWDGTTAHDGYEAVTHLLGNAPADIAALVAEVSLLQQEARIQRAISDGLAVEVEHLRATVAALRASVPPTHPADYGHEVWSAALVEAKKEGARSAVAERATERAAVVAFLTGENDARCRFISDHVAMRIERGSHRREETE